MFKTAFKYSICILVCRCLICGLMGSIFTGEIFMFWYFLMMSLINLALFEIPFYFILIYLLIKLSSIDSYHRSLLVLINLMIFISVISIVNYYLFEGFQIWPNSYSKFQELLWHNYYNGFVYIAMILTYIPFIIYKFLIPNKLR